MAECLTSAEILGKWSGTASRSVRARADAHLAECATCRQELARLRQADFRRNLNAGLWIVSIGLVSSAIVSGALNLASVGAVLHEMAVLYAKFPSQPRPWLATSALHPLPAAVVMVLRVLAFVAVIGMGFLVVRKLKPATWIGDALLGLLTALAAGVFYYGLAFGDSVVVTDKGIKPADLELLARNYGVPALEGADPALKRYPDLAKQPEAERGKLLAGKVFADNLISTTYAHWVSLPIVLLAWAVAGVGQAVSGGFLLRRGDRRLDLLIHYLELALPVTWLGREVVLIGGPAPGSLTALRLAVPLGLIALAVVGLRRPWPWLIRFALYVSWYFAGQRLLGEPTFAFLDRMAGLTFPLFAWLDVVFWLGAVYLVYRYFRGGIAGDHPAARPPAPASNVPHPFDALVAAPPPLPASVPHPHEAPPMPHEAPTAPVPNLGAAPPLTSVTAPPLAPPPPAPPQPSAPPPVQHEPLPVWLAPPESAAPEPAAPPLFTEPADPPPAPAASDPATEEPPGDGFDWTAVKSPTKPK